MIDEIHVAGDLFGSGTVSGTADGSAGCLLEMTRGNRNPVTLRNGETRAWLADGDEVNFVVQACRAGYAAIGFGECRGTVTGHCHCPGRDSASALRDHGAASRRWGWI